MKYFVLEFAISGKGGKFVDTRNKSHESRKSINFSLYFMAYLNDNINSSTWYSFVVKQVRVILCNNQSDWEMASVRFS